ncbi:MAG TPA: acyltransferase [Actinocrinis sp.]|jgi:peptidoglycan/LPS O-acetylase OafA/YrhL|uniref:acyltransferase family protein n=1 Tax=Actinocrinis sp. TaxID=1920516 RepID=UPI002DDD2C69|nr:acyltransferase [Actinocrinis sp.]HEV3171265.1 acyltransferase [Actinocrinis sp.]
MAAVAVPGQIAREAPQASTPPSSPKKHAPRLLVLDGLRLVAATMVVAGHWLGTGIIYVPYGPTVKPWGKLGEQQFPGLTHSFAAWGWMGVELFFLISGFVICMSAWGRSLGQFGLSRVARLFPAYWFGVLVSAGVLVFLPSLGAKPRSGFASDLMTNLTMAQTAYGVGNLDAVYWTLWQELLFYLLFGIVVAMGLTYRRVVLFCCAWTVASLIAAASGDSLLNAAVQPHYSPFFISGVAFFLMYKFGPTMLLWGLVVFSFLLGQHGLYNDAVTGAKAWNWHDPMWHGTAILITFYVIMSLVATHKLDWIRWRFLITAGALTYPLYLLHQDIGFTAIKYLHDKIAPWPLVLGLYAAMLVFSWLVHRLVEKPGSRWLRKGINKSLAAMHEAPAANA